MMSKFKQLRLRLVVAVAVLLMAGMGTEAFAQCYTKNLQQAESLYKQGRYAEAKKRFAAAKACPDKPKTNNLDSRIAACNRKIKERSSSSTQPSRRQSTPSTTSRTNSFKITSVSFRNEDIDDNVLNAYGERLCAADVHYLMPRIYYKSTYSSSQDWAFKYKIYKPDGTLMSGSTSPSGYTNSFEMTVDPGENYCGIGGWGRSGRRRLRPDGSIPIRGVAQRQPYLSAELYALQRQRQRFGRHTEGGRKDIGKHQLLLVGRNRTIHRERSVVVGHLGHSFVVLGGKPHKHIVHVALRGKQLKQQPFGLYENHVGLAGSAHRHHPGRQRQPLLRQCGECVGRLRPMAERQEGNAHPREVYG